MLPCGFLKVKRPLFVQLVEPNKISGPTAWRWSLTLREERGLRVFENGVLGRIIGSERDAVAGEWRKLHNEELNDLFCSPNIVRVIKSRRMRSVGHVARMGERRGVYRVLVGNLRERDHLEDTGVDERI